MFSASLRSCSLASDTRSFWTLIKKTHNASQPSSTNFFLFFLLYFMFGDDWAQLVDNQPETLYEWNIFDFVFIRRLSSQPIFISATERASIVLKTRSQMNENIANVEGLIERQLCCDPVRSYWCWIIAQFLQYFLFVSLPAMYIWDTFGYVYVENRKVFPTQRCSVKRELFFRDSSGDWKAREIFQLLSDLANYLI